MSIHTEIISDHHHSVRLNQVRNIAEKEIWKMIHQCGEENCVLEQGCCDGVCGRAVGSRYDGGAGARYGGDQNCPPNSDGFHYRVSDGRGNFHYRSEYTDLSGAVRGSYGYSNARGRFRVVEYVADARGFRANITTNEPATGDREYSASVNIVPEQHPAVIQDGWTKSGERRYGGVYEYGAG